MKKLNIDVYWGMPDNITNKDNNNLYLEGDIDLSGGGTIKSIDKVYIQNKNGIKEISVGEYSDIVQRYKNLEHVENIRMEGDFIVADIYVTDDNFIIDDSNGAMGKNYGVKYKDGYIRIPIGLLSYVYIHYIFDTQKEYETYWYNFIDNVKVQERIMFTTNEVTTKIEVLTGMSYPYATVIKNQDYIVAD